VTHVGS